MKRIMVTGGSGFVGRTLLERLHQEGHELIAPSRSPLTQAPVSVVNPLVGGLAADVDWTTSLEGVSVVIHSAARVHVMNDTAADPLVEFRKANVDGTLSLARQAAAAGVQRFVFISSIKVNGEGTQPGHAYRADDTPAPQDPYGVSKMEAEQGLRSLANETGMQVVIIRPVLVYGPGVKANFRSMMSWLRKGIPLPLGATGNKRSLVAVDNLVDLIATCIDHPAAANQTFLVSDGEDLSTTQLLQRMGNALGRPARLLPVPATLLQAGAAMLGRRAIAQRLCGSLQVDIAKTRELLGWTPPVSVDDALRKTALAFDAG
ncbi:nucleoside-diphosphate-sugar epimerase [Pseudomonas sp. BIGb0408]|uniref:Nucleoside-diphosphate-sugar epimerase n=1 Tax=Phytopseudomonas flavescens TaxID=29435 RepID=A0A1G8L614_9GAMM|nr:MULTISPECIES: SDR family oxidoreductase [Pseudomonas]MCW2292130.1 nucleoside-diphosphate-sugar epimerase [Pseudomonas sp. BIGb0408]NYH73298.1 nucleoside-diphosphate-sugar epimerase [Pseudomonas flavescens]SDI51139.1 Nucleoside-diphosphate-sugar epimerase [Pseudomonas flavescens]